VATYRPRKMPSPNQTAPAAGLPTHVDVAIVGAGFAGLGTAIKLRQAGRHDFVVLEKADEVGGTWEANTYPGCQCDVPSNLYSFSFAPKPDWSQTFALQPEIWSYLRDVADEFGLRGHLRLGCELELATWHEGAGLWRLETSRGAMTARIVVAGMGGLSTPSIPDLPGLEGFEGAAFHTARWEDQHDLRGRRVAVIGTGASAVQVVPKIQPEVEHLTVFQRTPPWILPHPGRPVRPREQRLFSLLPGTQRAVRAAVYWGRETFVLGFQRHRLSRVPRQIALRHLEEQVPDPGLRRTLTPAYEIGCKRILLSNEYFPALQQPNVELVANPVTAVRPRAVVTAGGREHEVDTIVWGTGFKVTEMEAGEHFRGRDGRLLGDVWREGGLQALRGTTVAGFPNLFLMVGPNTALGHNSIVFIIESQLAFLMDALRQMDARRATVLDTKPDAQAAFNDDVQRRMRGTVWVDGGCSSWYIDRHGRNTTLWPGTSWSFRQATRRFDPAEHLLEAV
jgi:cation diffusion facilitator CzcD-associated flavoprotein CzcO